MYKGMHIAAQYLAAAGKSFLAKQADDSHINLGWNTELRSLVSRPFTSKEIRLTLNYNNYRLVWVDAELQPIDNFTLSGATHKEALEWLEESSKEVGMVKPYSFDLHYELPYDNFNDNYVFTEIDEDELDLLIENRDLVQEALEVVLGEEQIDKVRVWPHHFDTGAIIGVSPEHSIGLGLAIPDQLSDKFYLYIRGYDKNGAIDTSSFSKIPNGKWMSPDWNGAMALADELSFQEMLDFFNSGIAEIRKNF